MSVGEVTDSAVPRHRRWVCHLAVIYLCDSDNSSTFSMPLDFRANSSSPNTGRACKTSPTLARLTHFQMKKKIQKKKYQNDNDKTHPTNLLPFPLSQVLKLSIIKSDSEASGSHYYHNHLLLPHGLERPGEILISK